jgi:hypothetical protein
MQKTRSQKIARCFEIVGYVLFMPFTLLLVLSNFYPLISILYLLSCALLIGFVRHSRGTVKSKWFPLLWLGNIIFCLALTVIAALFFLFAVVLSFGYRSNDSALVFLILLLIICSLIAGLFYSFVGLIANLEENSNKRRKPF